MRRGEFVKPLKFMPLPKDLELTKLRIRAEREKRELDRLEGITLKQRNVYEPAWYDFVERCKELGFCPVCETQKEACKCSGMA